MSGEMKGMNEVNERERKEVIGMRCKAESVEDSVCQRAEVGVEVYCQGCRKSRVWVQYGVVCKYVCA
jgi:hypothetical protein